MQSRIAALNQTRQLADDERLILKIGLHSGPCLHVTLNERPDYFGTTVNVAARVQGLSHGQDVVFTDSIRTETDVQPLLASRTLQSETVSVKGIEGAFTLHRLQL
jgi:class 3 adenylate cyclase